MKKSNLLRVVLAIAVFLNASCPGFAGFPEQLDIQGISLPSIHKGATLGGALENIIHENQLQSAIWYAQYLGETAKADDLKKQLETAMQGQFEWKESKELRGQIPKFIIEFRNGMKGLFKPDLRCNQ